MFRLDYISCLLTVLSTILIGRRLWHGWIVAAANSIIICIIGAKTGQAGFIFANLFCLALYGYNLVQWRTHRREASSKSEHASDGGFIARWHKPRTGMALVPRRPRASTEDHAAQINRKPFLVFSSAD